MESFRKGKRTPSAWLEPKPGNSEGVHGEVGQYYPFEASPTVEVVDPLNEQFRLKIEQLLVKALMDIIKEIGHSASTIKYREAAASFDAQPGLSTRQYGKHFRDCLAGRISGWMTRWSELVSRAEPLWDLPLPTMTKEDLICFIKDHYKSCNSSSEEFLNPAWMKYTFGQRFTNAKI
ncbi:hypothetical protein F4801DRAFT_585173 [Xylaria longipes]|nr:hypothetical protein F4801DRAFT_585173 [Xylaria longipes]